MEFVEGASRLKGGAKALDIWRIETKIEANCVDSSWKFMESIHFDTSFLGPQNFELTSKSCLWIGVSKKTAHRNDFAWLFELILDITENAKNDNDFDNLAMTMMLIIMMMHDDDDEGFNHDD